jgi:hypothetical protein
MVNETAGAIDATGINPLTFRAGVGTVITNLGTFEASGAGGLIIQT